MKRIIRTGRDGAEPKAVQQDIKPTLCGRTKAERKESKYNHDTVQTGRKGCCCCCCCCCCCWRGTAEARVGGTMPSRSRESDKPGLEFEPVMGWRCNTCASLQWCEEAPRTGTPKLRKGARHHTRASRREPKTSRQNSVQGNRQRREASESGMSSVGCRSRTRDAEMIVDRPAVDRSPHFWTKPRG